MSRICNSIKYHFWYFIHYHFPYFWAKRLYRQELGKTLTFSNPRDINEKYYGLSTLQTQGNGHYLLINMLCANMCGRV